MMNMRELLTSDEPVNALYTMVNDNTLREFEPALADLRMPIPKGYHHKDNLIHSIKVLENAINAETNGPDLILRTAALLHDIGKPATRKFDGRKNVTFDGHEHVGSGISRKILEKHGYTKKEIKEICLIIKLHMRSHGFGEGDWTDTGVRRLINDVNDSRTLERLLIVFDADATTANLKKREAHHRSVAKLREEIMRVEREDARKALRPALNGNEVMELMNLTQGRELGAIMKFLNTDEGIALSRDEAIDYVKKNF